MPLPLGVKLTRKLAVLFGFNCGVRPFYAAHRFDELSRVSTTSQHTHLRLFWQEITLIFGRNIARIKIVL